MSPIQTTKQFFNVGLRLSTLVAKLGLTLYMGRYLSLADIGNYGLVFGAVMILSVGLGFRFDYIVSRDLVGVEPAAALSKMRDQAVFYLLNHLGFALVMMVLVAAGGTGAEGKVLFYIFALSVAENLANMANANMISLGHPLLATMLFFVRAGLWALPVVAMGLIFPVFRNGDTILIGWLLGSVASLIMTLWLWRHMPWRAVLRTPVDWPWVGQGVRKSCLIWLGTLGAVGGIYVDRFIVMRYLGIDSVGIATFYFSFANALLALIQSGVLAFVYPRLITLHRTDDRAGFMREAKQAAWHVALFGGGIALIMGVGVPLLGRFFHRPELVAESLTLWLMLLGVWVRSNAETLYTVLFARHRDRPIWLGNLLFLIPAFGCNALFVPIFGLSGIGYGGIVAGLFLFSWYGWHVSRPAARENHFVGTAEETLESFQASEDGKGF
jgi:O-antigen/teichoic acid export membrane protein